MSGLPIGDGTGRGQLVPFGLQHRGTASHDPISWFLPTLQSLDSCDELIERLK